MNKELMLLELMNLEQMDTLAAHKKNTKHFFHIVFNILTSGLWIPVWLGISYYNRSYNRLLTKAILNASNGNIHFTKPKLFPSIFVGSAGGVSLWILIFGISILFS